MVLVLKCQDVKWQNKVFYPVLSTTEKKPSQIWMDCNPLLVTITMSGLYN